MKALFQIPQGQNRGKNVYLMISLLVILFTPTFAAATSYNAVNEFGSTNPTAPWSYGYETTLGVDFTLLGTIQEVMQAWQIG